MSDDDKVFKRCVTFGAKFAEYFSRKLLDSHAVALREAKADAKNAGAAGQRAAAMGEMKD